MEQREPSERYSALATQIIDDPLLDAVKNSQVRIAYLESDWEKKSQGRPVLGQCEKVPDRFRWSVPYDFTITIFQPNVEHLNDKQLKILLLHELMHVGIEVDGNEEKYHVVPHDVEDFYTILDRYGMRWADE
ncbi:MAG: hypothetical protein IJX68_08790 [Rikenellaceae bacterium]|nr:hypothetical protein [Rikenellaceae bacterium]